MPKPNEYTIRAKHSLEGNLCVPFFALFCCTDFRGKKKNPNHTAWEKNGRWQTTTYLPSP